MPQLGRLVSDLGPDKVLLDRPDRVLYRYDAIAEGEVPLAVALPERTEDVAALVRWSRASGVPLVPRGAASGLSGGSVPVTESVVVAFTRMRELRIDPGARLAEAQPGVVTVEVSEAAAAYDLYYPPDPASHKQSTLGGNLAENAGGPQCFKKGVTGDYVHALEWVDAEGEVRRATREAHDLVGLLVGSEGTLGLITRAWLRLEPRPKHTRTLAAYFGDVGAAAQAASRAIAAGVVPAKLEFMDGACLRAVEDAFRIGLPRDAAAMLLVDTDGDDLEIVEEELELVAAACREAGGRVQRAGDAQEAGRLWQARRAVSAALGRIHPHRMNEDIVVPRSKLAEVVRRIHELGEASPWPLVQFGHIGDGNLHPNILYDARETPHEEVHELAHAIARVALEHGGVISGEHGIGLTKRAFLAEALPEPTLSALRRVKRAFDPESRFNPGKVLP